MVDVELFAQSSRIEEALSKHSCTECLQWCLDNKSNLRKMKVGGAVSFLCVPSSKFVLEHSRVQSSIARVCRDGAVGKDDGGAPVCSKALDTVG